MGCSSGVDLGLLVSVKGKLNASAYRNLLDNSVLLTVCEQFGDGSPLTLSQCKPEAHKDTPLGSTRKSVFVFSNVLLNKWAKVPTHTPKSSQRSVVAAKGNQLHINT